jgi:hypothetical protein
LRPGIDIHAAAFVNLHVLYQPASQRLLSRDQLHPVAGWFADAEQPLTAPLALRGPL